MPYHRQNAEIAQNLAGEPRKGLVSKKTAALSLKYAIEDIEAMELTVLDEFSGNDGKARVMTATYEVR